MFPLQDDLEHFVNDLNYGVLEKSLNFTLNLPVCTLVGLGKPLLTLVFPLQDDLEHFVNDLNYGVLEKSLNFTLTCPYELW